MNSFELQAWKKWYPWLEKILVRSDGSPWDAKDFTGIKGGVLTPKILKNTPVESHHTGSIITSYHYDVYKGITLTGEVVEELAKKTTSSSSNYAYVTPSRTEGEMLAEGIDRQGLADKLAYICHYSRGYDDCNNVDYRTVTIYPVYPDPSDLLRKMIKGIKEEAKRVVEERVMEKSVND